MRVGTMMISKTIKADSTLAIARSRIGPDVVVAVHETEAPHAEQDEAADDGLEGLRRLGQHGNDPPAQCERPRPWL